MFISILSKWSITLAKEQDILNILSMVKIFMRYLPPKPLSIDIWWHPTVHWLLQHVGECNPVCLCNSHLHCAMPAASQPPSVLKNGTEIYTKHLNSRIHHTFGLCLCKVFVSNNFSFFFFGNFGKIHTSSFLFLHSFCTEMYKSENQLPWYAAQWIAFRSFLSFEFTLAPLLKSKLTICKIYHNRFWGFIFVLL